MFTDYKIWIIGILLGFITYRFWIRFQVFKMRKKVEYVKTIYVDKRFTKRQLQILKLIIHGKRTAEIAKILEISPLTVATHRKAIMKRSGCRSVYELVKYCEMLNIK